LYEPDASVAKRLLAEAGHPGGFKTPFETTPGFGPDFMDAIQVAIRNWKAAGVEVDLKLKEYGAFVATTIFGKFDKMAGGLFGGTTDPDSYVYRTYMPGQPLNAGGVDDPKATEMIKLQRRTFDANKRRDILWDLQRYLSQQVYYLYGPSVNAVAAWAPYVRNFGPNIGHDRGAGMLPAGPNRWGAPHPPRSAGPEDHRRDHRPWPAADGADVAGGGPREHARAHRRARAGGRGRPHRGPPRARRGRRDH